MKPQQPTMKVATVFSSATFFISICTLSYGNVVKMTVDLVESYKKPTAVTAVLCWKTQEKIEFANRLGDLKHPSTIRFVKQKDLSKEPVPKDTLIVVDLTCPNIGYLLKEANKTNMFRSPYRWLLLDHQSDENNSTIPSCLEDINILHDSDVILAVEDAEEHFEMHLIYKLREKPKWVTEYYGTWMSSNGLLISDVVMKTTKILRRRNLQGEQFAVSFNVDDKEVGFSSTSSDHNVTQWGFHQIIALYDFVNATRVNCFADDWGYFVNGSWNGIVGNLARGEAEIAGTPIFMAKERFKHIKYLTNTVQTSVKFVFREPPLSYQDNLFLLPFNKAVWYSLFAFVLLMMAVIYVNALWEKKKNKIIGEKKTNAKRQCDKMTVSDVAMMIVGAISQQGSYIELRGSTGRLLMFTLFLAFLFLFTAYSASIVALLQSSSKQIRTLSDLLNSRLELGVHNTTYNVHYFTNANDPVRKAIYETKIAPKGSKPKFMSLEEGVRKLQKHPFAFNMDIGVGYRMVEKYFYEPEKCGLQEIAYIPTSKPWLTCKKTSPHAELFTIGLYRIREHGISDRANARVYSKKPVCSVSGGKFDSVSIVDVYPPLLMLLYGMLLACVLLVAEVFIHRHRHKVNLDFDSSDVTIALPSA